MWRKDLRLCVAYCTCPIAFYGELNFALVGLALISTQQCITKAIEQYVDKGPFLCSVLHMCYSNFTIG